MDLGMMTEEESAGKVQRRQFPIEKNTVVQVFTYESVMWK